MTDSNEGQVPQEPQQFETAYHEYLDQEPMDPVEEMGDEENHPERFETAYSKYAEVTEPTDNVDE